MTTIELGTTDQAKPLRVDIAKLLQGGAFITASSGQGKSWLMRRLIEQIITKVQVIVLDPEGEFNTLREKYPMLLVGEGGEVAAEARTAGLLARKLVELRLSAVIDLYSLGEWSDRRAYVAPFLTGLMNVPKALYHPIVIAIDEAHQFAPKAEGSSAKEREIIGACKRAVNLLSSAGRKRGFRDVLASQRISQIHNDAIADLKNRFIGGITLSNDQQRAADELGLMTKPERVALRDLEPGEFHAYGPALNQRGVVRFKSGPVLTTHPQAGKHALSAPPPTPDAIKTLAQALADLPAEAQAERDELAASQKRVRELEQQLRARPVQTLPAPPAKVERVVERVEVPIFRDGEVKRLEAAVATLAKVGAQLVTAGETFKSAAAEVSGRLTVAAAPRPAAPPRPARLPAGWTPERPAPRAPAPAVATPATEPGEFSPTAPQQRILDTLAWLESVGLTPVDKVQLAALTPEVKSAKSSSYGNNLGVLRTAGLIAYPQGGTAALTDASRARAAAADQPPTTDELQRRIIEKLGGKRGAMIRELAAVYPEPLYKDVLAERTGQSPTSSSYGNSLGALRGLGLIDYPATGQVVALPVLFLD